MGTPGSSSKSLIRRTRGATGALTLDSPVGELSGIGPKRAELLAGRGLTTVRELLFHLPSRYEDWRDVKPIRELHEDTVCTVAGRLRGLTEGRLPRQHWRRLVSGWLEDQAGARIRVVWFNVPTYWRERLLTDARVVLHGKVGRAREGRLELTHPEVQTLEGSGALAIRPAYRAGEMIGRSLMRSAMAQALTVASGLGETIPAALRTERGMPTVAEAIGYLHQPPAEADIAMLASGRTLAHKALAMDELFGFELALLAEREESRRQPGIAFNGPERLSRAFVDALPFELTASQGEALGELRRDLAASRPMNRLLIGDVGSGKTVVALWAALRAIEHGHQAALMAPTELLAEQHCATFEKFAAPLGVPFALLSGAVKGAARSQTLERLANGEPMLVFGTHALIQSRVRIPALGLAVIDEQHRFGVFDRIRLKALGPRADMLLLSATPIPRSLARVLLTNLDVTVLEGKPAGRAPVTTRSVAEADLPEVWTAVRAQLAAGQRAYCILPFIESEDQQELAVTSAVNSLRAHALKGFKLGVMHGRLPGADKELVMRQFRDGEIQVLISTTVVEVGIDVPEATAIVIMGAERYGLAQLHQLRGRIGRGSAPAVCYLVASAGAEAGASMRLQVLVEKSSGAAIAAADLELRGPGDLLGARQAGPLPLRFAHWLGDFETVTAVRELANRWLLRDPELKETESVGVRAALARWRESALNREQSEQGKPELYGAG